MSTLVRQELLSYSRSSSQTVAKSVWVWPSSGGTVRPFYVGAVGGYVDGLGDGELRRSGLRRCSAGAVAQTSRAAFGESGLSEEAVEVGDLGVLVLGVGVGADGVGAVDTLGALRDGQDGEGGPCWLSKSRLVRARFHSPSSTRSMRRSTPRSRSWAWRELAAGRLAGAAEVAHGEGRASSQPRP